MSSLGIAAAVVVLLGVLILVHELGHFVFAKLFDVKVLRFSLGFGPRIVRHHLRRDRIPAVGDPARRLRAPAGRGSRRSDPAHGPAARAGGEAAVAALHASSSPGRCSTCCWRCSSTSSTSPASARCCRRPSGRCCPTCPPATAGLLPGDRVESVDGHRIRYWEELETRISTSAGKTLRFAIRRGPDAEERDVTPIEIERSGPFRRKERVGWIGVTPRFHLPEIGVLDPSSPAAQAGLKTFDFITAVNGVPVATWAEFARAVERAGASPLRLNYVRGGYSAVPFAHIEIEEPGSAVVIPVAVFDAGGPPPLRDRHPVGRAVRVLRRARQPRRPDRPAARRSDRVDRRRAAGGLGRAARAAGEPPREGLPHRLDLGRRRASRGELPPGDPVAAGREPPGGTAAGVRRAQPARLEDRGAVPITNRFTYSVGHAFKHTARDHRDDGVRLRRDRARARPADGAGQPAHDRLRRRRRGRAGPGPVPVADGGHQHQPRPAQFPPRADPRRRPAGVLHAGAVQAAARRRRARARSRRTSAWSSSRR